MLDRALGAAILLLVLWVPSLAAQSPAPRPAGSRGDDAGGNPPSRQEVARALRRAAEFYRHRVATRGGYHFSYTHDLSYGRSEQGEGPTQVEVQRAGTPIVGMAYLTAYEATRDPFYLDAARETAHALVQGQLCSGGWHYFIEFDPEKRRNFNFRVDGCGGGGEGARRFDTTTLDDNVTQAALRLLMRVDRELRFADREVHEAALYALDRLSKAQYPNGAWPQRFSRPPDPARHPVKKASYPESWPRTWPGQNYDYTEHYTFNDNTLADLIDTFLEAARIYEEPRYRAAAERGGDFILLAQMPEPQPGWAQQYDRDMHPVWARRFEPPSITGGEAQGILKILMVLYRETGDRKYLEPIPRALRYYRASLLPEVSEPSEIRARTCPPGTPCLARFYELGTNRPLYVSKGIRASIGGQSTAILSGYDLTYGDSSVITHYAVLVQGGELESLAREYELLEHARAATIRRPERLHGLSPWSADPAPGKGDRTSGGATVAAILRAMDERGAWTEEGYIGGADRVVSLFAAEPMTVKLGERVLTMAENETLEVFRGAEPLRERIISSRTFAENVETLAAYLR